MIPRTVILADSTATKTTLLEMVYKINNQTTMYI